MGEGLWGPFADLRGMLSRLNASNQSSGLGSPNTYKSSSVKAVEFGANHQLLRLIKNTWGDVTHLIDKLPELKQPITISVLIWLL